MFYTQSVVSSQHFLPTPCYIPGPWSAVCSLCIILIKKVNYEMCLYILAEVSTSGNQKFRDSIFSITLPPPRISNINDQTPHTFHAPLTPHKLGSLYEVLNSLLRL